MPATSRRLSFVRKAVAALLLVILAQWLFYGEGIGATLGGFALVWCAVLAAAVPRVRRGAPAAMLGVAAVLAVALLDDPSLLGWLLFSAAIATAVLLPRRRFDDAATWFARLLSCGLYGAVAPLRDIARVMRRRSASGISGASVVALLALPLLGGALFLALFAVANPVIGSALTAITPPSFRRSCSTSYSGAWLSR